jgi:LPXTG-site transpeptidase (sortase) family protein
MSPAAMRGHHAWPLALASVLLIAVGAVAWFVQQDEPGGGAAREQGPTAGASDATPGSAPEPASTGRPPAARPAPTRAGAPRRIAIPALGVRAPVVPIQTRGDVLVPPSDPRSLGWWAAGARPGDRRGSALLTGHTVHTGGGALDDLEELEPGDRVTVTVDDGLIRYDVHSVRTYGKGQLAARAERLFSQQAKGRLVLVTCEDWDGTQYLSNVVVIATPA